MDSEAIVAGLVRGDSRAFDAAYDRLRAPLYGFLVRLTGSGALAEDLLQETWLRLRSTCPPWTYHPSARSKSAAAPTPSCARNSRRLQLAALLTAYRRSIEPALLIGLGLCQAVWVAHGTWLLLR